MENANACNFQNKQTVSQLYDINLIHYFSALTAYYTHNSDDVFVFSLEIALISTYQTLFFLCLFFHPFQMVLLAVLLVTVLINILFIAETGRRLREAQVEGNVLSLLDLRFAFTGLAWEDYLLEVGGGGGGGGGVTQCHPPPPPN